MNLRPTSHLACQGFSVLARFRVEAPYLNNPIGHLIAVKETLNVSLSKSHRSQMVEQPELCNSTTYRLNRLRPPVGGEPMLTRM